MARALIIGYGNRLRGDDAIGCAAAESLADLLRDEPIDILAVHQLTPELAEPVSRASGVIFMDASYEGLPGTWKSETLEPAAGPGALGHYLTPEGLLACAKAIFHTAPPALLVSIAAGSFHYGEALTAPVSMALPGILRHVRELLPGLHRLDS